MAETFLIIREDRFGIDAVLSGKNGKRREVQALLRMNYFDFTDIAEDRTPFDAALEQLVQQLDVHSCAGVILMLPASLFYFRNTALPFTASAKIRQVLPLELNTRFPVELESVVTDFLKYEQGNHPQQRWVFSGSIKEETLDAYYQSLVRIGLRPAVITPVSAGMAACLLKQDKTRKHFIFFDATLSDMSLVLVVNADLVAVRTFSTGISFTMVGQALKQELLGFWQRTGVQTPFDMYVAEKLGEEDQKELAEVFKEVLSFQKSFLARELSPENHAAAEPALSFVGPDGLLEIMTPGLGKLLNMCQGKYASDSLVRTYASYIAASCALGLLAFILFMVNIHLDISRLEKQVSQKEAAIAAVFSQTFPEKKTGRMDPLLLMEASVREATRNQGGGSDDLSNAQGSVQAGAVLLELSNRIPKALNIEVDRLMLDKTRMILSGSAGNFNAIDQVKGLLEKSPLFRKVEIGSAVAGKKGNRVDFKFVIEI